MKYINNGDGSSKAQGVLKKPPQKTNSHCIIIKTRVSRYLNKVTGPTTIYECHKQSWHC